MYISSMFIEYMFTFGINDMQFHNLKAKFNYTKLGAIITIIINNFFYIVLFINFSWVYLIILC